MLRSDKTFKEAGKSGPIIVDPWEEGLLQSASVDLRLGYKLRVFRISRVPYIDVKPVSDLTEVVEIDELNHFYLHPHEFGCGGWRTQSRCYYRPANTGYQLVCVDNICGYLQN